jgi:hypothetical protein
MGIAFFGHKPSGHRPPYIESVNSQIFRYLSLGMT